MLGALLLIRALAGDGEGLGDIGSGGGPPPEEEEAGALFPTGDALYRQRVIGDPASAVQAYRTALEQAARIRGRTRTVAPELAQASWTSIGRRDVGGRVVDLAVDPIRPETVYAATANGGLWRSEDAGVSWTPSWQPVASQTMGAVTVGPDGALFAGTGLPHPAAGFVLWGGTGVFRSEDRGETWEGVGLESSGAIARIAVDPTDPQRVYVAAAGSPLREGGERGVYRSVDGGGSWELSLAAANPTTGAVDVAVDPSDPQRLLATLWDRDILSGRIAGAGSAVYLSTDGGEQWTEVTLPGNVRDPRVGRMGVTFGPAGSDRAYAVVANDLAGETVGLWRSDDGGRTWEKASDLLSGPGRTANGWWFGEAWVDPRDPDRVFVAGAALLESMDGGETFTANVRGAAEGAGADSHTLAWDPRDSERVYLGGAAGVSRSLAGGRARTWVPAASQGWTLQYSVEERSLSPSTLGTITLDPSTTPAAIAFDEEDPNVAYYGGRTVNRTEDGGRTWTAISPDLTVPPGGEADPFAVVTVVTPPPAGTRVMYAGTSNGLVWRSSDLGRSWDPAPLGIGKGWVTRVAVDPSDPVRAWVSLSGYGDRPHVLATIDGGRTWTDASGDLPDAPVNDLLVLPGRGLAAASDLGVYVTSGRGEWLALGSGLPALPVLDMRYEPDRAAIVAATFGAGFQEVQLPRGGF